MDSNPVTMGNEGGLQTFLPEYIFKDHLNTVKPLENV